MRGLLGLIEMELLNCNVYLTLPGRAHQWSQWGSPFR